MSPDSLTTRRSAAGGSLFVLIFWGAFALVHAQWHADWPLDPTGVVKTVYFSNLVEATIERQLAMGYDTLEIETSNILVIGTNETTVTNTFGTNEVISTNYVETYGTNLYTNVFFTTPDVSTIDAIDQAIRELLQDNYANWMAPWFTNAAGEFTDYYALTNSSGDPLPDETPPIIGDSLIGFGFDEIGYGLGWMASYLEMPLTDLYFARDLKTDDWGRVRGGQASMIFSPQTYDVGSNILVIAQGNYHSNTTHGKRFTRLTNTALSSVRILDMSAVGPGKHELEPLEWPNTNTPILRYTYGGTNVLDGGLDLILTGETFGGVFDTRLNTNELVNVTGEGEWELTSTWTGLRGVLVDTGEVPNVATNQNSLYGGDMIEVFYPSGTVWVSSGLADSDAQGGQTEYADRYIRPEALNYYRDILNMMFIVGAGSSVHSARKFDVQWTGATTNERTGTSGLPFSNTWADAKAGAESDWDAASNVNDTGLPKMEAEGTILGGKYQAVIQSRFRTLKITPPDSATNFDFIVAVHLLTDYPDVVPTGNDAFNSNGFNAVFERVYPWTNLGVTNATQFNLTIGDGTLNTKPIWPSAPTIAGGTNEGFLIQPPANSDELPLVSFHFAANSDGFQFTNDVAYTNNWVIE